jgi:thioredoxin reductase (NADPH)
MPTDQTSTLPELQSIIDKEPSPFDIIIIGGGPAGLSAGIYACRSGLNTLLFERAIVGGLVTVTDQIENYPGFPTGIQGMELCRLMEEQATRFGLKFTYSEVAKIEKEPIPCKAFLWDNEKNSDWFKVTADGKTYNSRALILATGTHPKKLEVPGEEALTGKGVSYCAVCDGPFYKGKEVAVVGGGDSAVEEAIYLTRFASSVTIIHRRDQLRASKYVTDKALENPRIKFAWNSVVDEIKGKDHVKNIVIKDVRTGQASQLEVAGVFIYVGLTPNSKLFNGLAKLDERGFVVTTTKMETSCPGIFAAGDVRQKELNQVITAAADGATAAFSAERMLS